MRDQNIREIIDPAILDEPEEKEIWNTCLSKLEKFGVQSACYVVIPFRDEAQSSSITKASFVKHSHPRVWVNGVGARTLLDGDLAVAKILDGATEVKWHDLQEWRDATPVQMVQANAEVALDLGVGISIRLARDVQERCAVGIGLNMPDIPVNEFDEHWRINGSKISAICELFDQNARRANSTILVRLTKREKDVLAGMAIGLDRQQVAHNLGIVPKTVDKYIKATKSKLKAHSMAHAVAKAYALNLIRL